jgi:hypothetical protein
MELFSYLIIAVVFLTLMLFISREGYWDSDPDHLGCYRDAPRRALRYGPRRRGYDRKRCSHACRDYRYYGLQANGWCSCENSLAHATRYGPSKRCSKSGKGGHWSNDLYQNRIELPRDPDYIGCFKDTRDRALRFGPRRRGYNRDSCKRACRNYRFYALQNDGWCSCDYDFEHATKHGISDQCHPDRRGGPGANNLFEIPQRGALPDLDTTCDKDVCDL